MPFCCLACRKSSLPWQATPTLKRACVCGCRPEVRSYTNDLSAMQRDFFSAHLFDVRETEESRSPCKLRTTGPADWGWEGLHRATHPPAAGAVCQAGCPRRTALRAAWQHVCSADPRSRSPTITSGAVGWESHKLCDNTQGLGAPSASSFAGEGAHTLRRGPQELRVGNSFAPFCTKDGCTIRSGS